LGFGVWDFREATEPPSSPRTPRLGRKYPPISQITQILAWGLGFGVCDFPLRAGNVFLEVELTVGLNVA
jgi:hypothetical protein